MLTVIFLCHLGTLSASRQNETRRILCYFDTWDLDSTFFQYLFDNNGNEYEILNFKPEFKFKTPTNTAITHIKISKLNKSLGKRMVEFLTINDASHVNEMV